MDKEDQQDLSELLEELGTTSSAVATTLFRKGRLGYRGSGPSPLERYLSGILGTHHVSVDGFWLTLEWTSNNGTLGSGDSLRLTHAARRFHHEFHAGHWPMLEKSWRGWWKRRSHALGLDGKWLVFQLALALTELLLVSFVILLAVLAASIFEWGAGAAQTQTVFRIIVGCSLAALASAVLTGLMWVAQTIYSGLKRRGWLPSRH